jgi:hypothetical protein
VLDLPPPLCEKKEMRQPGSFPKNLWQAAKCNPV